jgi:hypothetical protein
MGCPERSRAASIGATNMEDDWPTCDAEVDTDETPACAPTKAQLRKYAYVKVVLDTSSEEVDGMVG